jgi:hypothetical protein
MHKLKHETKDVLKDLIRHLRPNESTKGPSALRVLVLLLPKVKFPRILNFGTRWR